VAAGFLILQAIAGEAKSPGNDFVEFPGRPFNYMLKAGQPARPKNRYRKKE